MIDYSEFDDNSLLKLSAEGDRYAEDALSSRYARLVRICARPLFLAGGDSEDLIQEGMLGLLSAIRQYKQGSDASFKTFAEHCIKNRIYTAIKTASSTRHSPLNAGISLEALLSDESQTTEYAYADLFQCSPEEQVLARENLEYAKDFFLSFNKSLSKLEKLVLNEYLKGGSYKEIARAINRDEKAVDNAIQRIRQKLAKSLKSGDISKS